MNLKQHFPTWVLLAFWGQITHCCGGCPVHCRCLAALLPSALWMPTAASPTSRVLTPTVSPDIANPSPAGGKNHPWMRTTDFQEENKLHGLREKLPRGWHLQRQEARNEKVIPRKWQDSLGWNGKDWGKELAKCRERADFCSQRVVWGHHYMFKKCLLCGSKKCEKSRAAY